MSTSRQQPSRRAAAFIVSSAVALILGAASAQAQQASAPARTEIESSIAFDIPQQPLTRALSRFGDVTRFQLVYEASLAEGKQSAAVTGTLTPEAALTQLLAGTGLTYRMTAPRTVTLEKSVKAAGARVLGPVQVEGRQVDLRGPGGTLGEVSARGGQELESNGYRPLVASVASNSPRAIEEIHRSISVLTPEQIERQDIQTFDEALKRLPGITYGQTKLGAPTITARGFSLNRYQVDGGAGFNQGNVDLALLDLGAYERLELVRGPNGVQTGQNSPGGSLNLVRKRPTSTERLTTEVQAGQWNFYRGELDYSTPTLFGAPIGLRTVTSYENREFFYDKAARESTNFYAIADMNPLSLVKVELGMRYNAVQSDSSYDGLPRFLEGPLLPFSRSTNFTPPWAIQNARSKEFFVKGFWDIASNWKLQGGVTRHQLFADESDYIRLVFFSQATMSTPAAFANRNGLAARDKHSDTRDLTYDLRLDGSFDTFGLRHAVSISADYTDSYGISLENVVRSSYDVDTLQQFLDTVNLPPNGQNEPAYDGQNWQELSGATFSDTVSWRDTADLSVSVRRNRGHGVNSNYVFPDPPFTSEPRTFVTKKSIADEWRPTYSAGVKLPFGLRAFATFAQGSRDQSTLYSAAGQLGQAVYENKELGLRFSNEDVLATVTWYRLTTEGMGLAIFPLVNACGPTKTGTCYFEGTSNEKSRGVDFEVTGALTRTLAISASFNYNSNETSYPPTTSLQGAALSSATPARTAKLWLDWTPPAVPALAMQLGITASGRWYETGSAYSIDPATGEPGSIGFRYDQGAYAVADLGARYAFSSGLSVSLLAENLTDRTYCQTQGYECFFGVPRSAKLTVKSVW